MDGVSTQDNGTEADPVAVDTTDEITYVITAVNNATDPLDTIEKTTVITDLLPANMTYVSSTPAATVTTEGDRTRVTWTFDNLPESDREVTVVGRVEYDAVDIVNTAGLTIDSDPEITSNTTYHENIKKMVTVGKIVAGDYGDHTKLFTFTVTVRDKTGAVLAQGTELAYTGGTVPTAAGANAAPTDGILTVGADGTTNSFELSHGQSIVISGIPSGGSVTVNETGEGAYETTYVAGEAAEQIGLEGTVNMENEDRSGYIHKHEKRD